MRRAERPIGQLPRPLLAAFVLLLGAQLVHHHVNQRALAASYRQLDEPSAVATYRAAAMGSEQLLGHLLALRLQLHDNQAGRHFRYSLMDYDRLIAWLERISDIAPGTEYPLLLASRIYSQTANAERLRQIIAFIERRFADDPQRHWRRMTEASLLAKHKLGDMALALRIAERLAQQPATVQMPHWARDFQFLLLAELNEYQSAIAIIEALLQSGAVKDVDEQRFLRKKMSDFRQKLSETKQPGSN